MARGGYRPGAGRPKSATSTKEKAVKVAADIRRAARAQKLSPLDYMLEVMNDDGADDGRRDRMAVAAAPFCHPRKSDQPEGKKAAAQEQAKTAGAGSSWGDDLHMPAVRPN